MINVKQRLVIYLNACAADQEFTCSELVEQADFHPDLLGFYLSLLTQKGHLKRVARGVYTRASDRPIPIPKSRRPPSVLATPHLDQDAEHAAWLEGVRQATSRRRIWVCWDGVAT